MAAERRGSERRGSLRHGLLFRLLTGSVLVAVCSITATAWLAVQRTSESITVQQGETLAVDTHIHDTLVGYAATHRGWEGVEETVRELAGETGRRIVLTTEGRSVIADSAVIAEGAAGDAPPLPPRTSSVVDALAVDVTLAAESGDRIDPRAVGPFALTDHERALVRADAEQGARCLRTLYGVPAEVVTGPTGRPAVQAEQTDVYMWADCGLDVLEEPVGGEEEALADLNARVSDCGSGSGARPLVYKMDGRTGGLAITDTRPEEQPERESTVEARAPAAPDDPESPSPADEPDPDPPGEEGGVEPRPDDPSAGVPPSSAPDTGDSGAGVPEEPTAPQDWGAAPAAPTPVPSDSDDPAWSQVQVPPETASCMDAARRAQLDPYVAPAALLFIDDPAEDAGAGLSLSREGALRVGGVVLLVLVLTVVVSTTLATRLLRPVHALTDAVNRMREGGGPARVEVRDSGEIGRLAEAFNEMSEHLEQAEEQRKAMVSDVSHELRTPLSNLRGWLEAVQDGVVAPEPDRMGMLLGETLLLQAVIDDLQDLALADAGRLRLSPEPVEVGPLVDQVAAGHGLRAEEAGVRLVAEVRDVTLVADRTRLLQVLGNLVGNALRHTPRGGTVTVRAHRAGSEAVLRVSDTGVGIAEGDLPHVFDRFWRADRSRNRRTGGSGLGLAIVRGLVELHGGTVAVSSTVGEGTTFTLRLPLAGPPEGGPAQERESRG
ncbi:cell wall metabolism sensor histidine kinase WalK [Nocardiopsis sp. CC223A]|uniref:sensor histidine kinase n=1 Tax=Nocardiopsis sp. CC223A TaxID=3044051 RepID=UPI00278C1129|nr:HAMP domain-containing sensor histidine kinase [Nocardiopsis sp. CC223A]